MPITTPGIHHITAIAGTPQRNVDFYAGVLGLRLVKRTVNFDDPLTYHLYYGDETGSPGSIMTFFPWPNSPRGRGGSGQINAVAFDIPSASVGAWIERLVRFAVPHEGPVKRFGTTLIALRDPDGLTIELVADPAGDRRPFNPEGSVSAEHALRGLHSATIWHDSAAPTGELLTGTLGFREVGREGSRVRYATGAGGPGAVLDVRETPGFWRGAMGVGTVHHIAWRLPDDAAEREARAELAQSDIATTDIIDRQYFHSVYFNEPGGVLFELATDPPGFTLDESKATLGTQLKLPSWLEARREEIESQLPPIGTPATPVGSAP